MPDFQKTKIGQYGPYTAFSVCGEEVRNSSPRNEEFGESAIHTDFPLLVPKNEIWVEDDVSQIEIPFVVANLLWREKLMLGGMPKEEAYNRALVYERQMRSNYRVKQPGDIRVSHIANYEQFTIWTVNGFIIRNRFKVDFIEGGNGARYKFIPTNELWIEALTHTEEWPFLIAHEYIEDQVMSHNGWKYEPAHKLASTIEYKLRERKDVTINTAIPMALEILRRMRIHG
jgi:hypothetical protein